MKILISDINSMLQKHIFRELYLGRPYLVSSPPTNFIMHDFKPSFSDVIQQKSNAIAVVYKANTMKLPTLMDMLLMDPVAVVDAGKF
jgi:hypothetical protein